MANGFSVFVNVGAKLLPSINASASKVEQRFAQMGSKVKVAAAETNLALKSVGKAAEGLASLAAAGGIVFTVKTAIKSGAEYEHELQALRNAGRTQGQVAEAIAAANRAVLELPTSTLASNLRMIGETSSAFGDYNHALENVGRNQKIAFLLNNRPGGHGGEEGDGVQQVGSLIRMLEMRGAANDPGRYRSETELAYKAMSFTRGQVGGEAFRQFGSFANPLVKTLSDRYLYKIAPSLMMELTPSMAGTAHQSLANTILGKVGMGGKVYAEGWSNLGMLDPKLAKVAKNGSVTGWHPGAIAGTNTFMQDPLQWAEQFLLPALKSHGVNTDDKMAMQIAISKLVGKNTAARLLGSLTDTNDRKRLHKDEGFVGQVQGIDKATLQTLMSDPTKGPEALKASLTNLGAAVSGPLLIPLARALVKLAEGVNRLAVVFQEHPGLGKAVAVLAGGLGALSAVKIGMSALNFLLPLSTIGEGIAAAGPMIVELGVWLRGATLAASLFAAVVGGPEIAAIGAVVAAIAVSAGAFAFVIYKKWDGIVAFVKGFVDGFAKAVMPLAKSLIELGQALSPIGKLLAAPFVALWEVAKPAVDLIMKFVAPPEVQKWHNWGEAAGGAIGGVVNGLTGLVNLITAATNGLNDLFHLKPSPISVPTSVIGAPGTSPVPVVRNPFAPHRAKGGNVHAGGLYTINENGEELFAPGRSGTIIPAAQTALLKRFAAMGNVIPFRPRETAPARSPAAMGTGAAMVAVLAASQPAAAAAAVSPMGDITIIVQGAHDPEATAAAVRRELVKMQRGQRAALHD